MPIKSRVLIFVYKHILPAAPNQTEVYTLQISHLSALEMKSRQKKEGGFWLVKIPQMTRHSLSFIKKPETPLSTYPHGSHSQNTCALRSGQWVAY